MASVAILRPRLGIGGAERLITDAAVALSTRGHRVTIYAPDRTDTPQFADLAAAGIQVDGRGGWIPSALAGRARLPMSIARALFAARNVAGCTPHVVICDVVPHILPLVKRLCGAPVLYYCHFPDMLTTAEGQRESAVYSRYRAPLDSLEDRGIAAADVVATNSLFTASIVRDTLHSMRARETTVIYPGVPVDQELPPPPPDEGLLEILSVARFDPRKNLQLAIEALHALRARLTPAVFSRVRLVLAGHHDTGLAENVALVTTLRELTASYGLDRQVVFAFSPSETERHSMLRQARCVMFTPLAEHFGYVPIEAMAAARPVVAVNHGGPTETVVHGETGYLCEPTGAAFAEALVPLLTDPALAARIGAAGHARVRDRFSIAAFGDTLNAAVERLASTRGVH